ncbi:hypothetical protein AMATHDRAFT_60611 [Amanita thiersii Skay4041]|uniref:Uncharacterized protein n=1 Tax=Amanita thiersii Skay4041 TaxID=703135 RepID=A0A2A9NJ78_9AGAR|nr:hypothetical protein AMATHDRAFT_60611 [Amanita thiersii Skay4041]
MSEEPQSQITPAQGMSDNEPANRDLSRVQDPVWPHEAGVQTPVSSSNLRTSEATHPSNNPAYMTPVISKSNSRRPEGLENATSKVPLSHTPSEPFAEPLANVHPTNGQTMNEHPRVVPIPEAPRTAEVSGHSEYLPRTAGAMPTLSQNRRTMPVNANFVPPSQGDNGRPVPPPMRVYSYLKDKRKRTMSTASVEARDGTAASTVVGSPTASVLSQPPIIIPPARDIIQATTAWRQELNGRVDGQGRRRITRPGVVFDLGEEPPREERRRRARPKGSRHRDREHNGQPKQG